jgi:hypothetical protein
MKKERDLVSFPLPIVGMSVLIHVTDDQTYIADV